MNKKKHLAIFANASFDIQKELVKSYIYYLKEVKDKENVDMTLLILDDLTRHNFKTFGLLALLKELEINVKCYELTFDKIKNDNILKEQLSNNYSKLHVYSGFYENAKEIVYSIRKNDVSELNLMSLSTARRYNFYYILEAITLTQPMISIDYFVIDYLELDISKIYSNVTYIPYHYLEEYPNRSDFYEKYLFRQQHVCHDKPLLFTFGFTIPETNCKDVRLNFYEYIKTKSHSECQIFLNTKQNNSFLHIDDYLNEISKSKFTYILPATDVTKFSSQRFYEAISRRCIPIIDMRCNLSECFEDVKDIHEFYVKNELLFNTSIENLYDKLQNLNYDKLIDEILLLPSISKYYM